MNDGGIWGWRAVQAMMVLVYIFMFAPIIAVVILSFNASRFGGFPMTGFSFRWYAKLLENEAVLRAFTTSLWIGVLTAMHLHSAWHHVGTGTGALRISGKELGQCADCRAGSGSGDGSRRRAAADQPLGRPKPSFLLLLCGHVLLSLPYVVLIVQARLIGVKRVYEEAAMSLGANRLQAFREITLPLIMPAVFAGLLLAFTISFDNVTASVFWRPAGVETMPTQILSMLKVSISPEVNALGTLMILVTVGVPLAGGIISRLMMRQYR